MQGMKVLCQNPFTSPTFGRSLSFVRSFVSQLAAAAAVAHQATCISIFREANDILCRLLLLHCF